MKPHEDAKNKARSRGNGRRLFWAMVLVAGIAALWWASPVGAQRRGGPVHQDAERHSVGELARAVRQAPGLAARYGLTADQATRLVDRLETRSAALEALAVRRDTLIDRLAVALAEPTGDRLPALRADARQLAADAVDETFRALDDLVAEVPPERRADLIEHWRDR
jgi:hypothetical protein